MDIAHKFHNRITYDLTTTCVAEQIIIKMDAKDLRSSRTFQKTIDLHEMDDQLEK